MENGQQKMDELAEQVKRFGDAVAWAEFVQTVEDMRYYQKSFFKERDQKILSKARELEKAVDLFIGRIKDKQQKLF